MVLHAAGMADFDEERTIIHMNAQTTAALKMNGVKLFFGRSRDVYTNRYVWHIL